MNQLGTISRLRRAATAAVAMLVALPIGLSSTVGAQDADYSLSRIAACSPGAGQSDVPGAGVLRITNNSDSELGYTYTTAAGTIADTSGIPAGGTVAVPIPSDDELPTVNVGGADVGIPAANGCGFGLESGIDPCPDREATGLGAFILNNLPEQVEVDVDGEPVTLDVGSNPIDLPFEASFVVTEGGEEAVDVTPAIGCVGPLSILVDEEPCTDSDPAVKDTFVVNRVAVPVTFTVNGTEASLDPGEARTFNDTGENPKVVVGGRQQALMNQDPIIGIPAVGCPAPAPSSPAEPPSSPSAPAPLSPKFTG